MSSPMPQPDVTLACALQLYEPDSEVLYSIEEVARLTHLPRRRIAIYCLHGLVSPVSAPETGGWFFNDEAIRVLRQVEQLHQVHGVSLPIIRLLLQLQAEVERLQQELRFWRGF